MNIAIIGYGKMGKEIEKIAKTRGINVVSIIDQNGKGATFSEINEKSMKNVDVCIDFTRPDAVIDNLQKISKFGKSIVIGTTGWNDKLGEAKKIVNHNNIGLIYASNFSIGVNIFFRIIKDAARMMNNVKGYDVFGYELHHSKKLDSPSGTAKIIEKILVDNIKRIDKVNFASLRAGSIPGTHIVGFDSSTDTIELKHTARNREGFALGAVMAAEWIQGKKGFFEINDMMNEMIGDKNV
ncbi:MAG TPA: dihydrodipicolinate reductase C-terminal domain-containing protein [Candidatus Nanoarchaeia archaeon]|nr:dihydrodipicolinate reductase C-terminal domain-containing protein [Candidatus Nanoarchaeia archaeon]